MGSLGTFKLECVRGHIRQENVDSTGHCLTCSKYRSHIRTEQHREKLLVFKPLCKWGHERRGNTTKNGNCKTCKKQSIEKGDHIKTRAWKRYGISNPDGSQFTINDYNRTFQIQGGRCKGCLKHQSEFKKALIADHSHETGEFRGLLCFQCNFILGLAKDKTEILEALTNYLRGQS